MSEDRETHLVAGTNRATMAASAISGKEAGGSERTETQERGGEWEKVLALARKQLDRFVSLEPRVLRGDDARVIHDIRVASRRLQQVMDLIYPAPAAKDIRRIRRGLRRVRRALSEVRNYDVLLTRVRGRLGRKRIARRETWEAIEQYIRECRAESLERGLRKLSKLNLALFYVHARACLGGNGANPERGHPAAATQQQAGADLQPEQFYERITASLERLSQSFEAQVAQSHRDRRRGVIHGARLAAKRLRYLVEVIREFGVPGSEPMLAWLRKLQQVLGEWHDLEILEELMIEMVARPRFLRDHLETAMEVEKLMVKNRAAKKAYEEKYFLMTLDSIELRQWREWVAYLLSSPSPAFDRA